MNEITLLTAALDFAVGKVEQRAYRVVSYDKKL